MRRYNICVKKTYKKDGQEKSTWPQVGTLVYFEANGQNKEGYKIELPMFGETVFYVFEQTERGSRAPQAPAAAEYDQTPKEITADEIPY